MRRAPATAKINLALVVGEASDGRHEVATVLQRVDLCDRITLEPAKCMAVVGFPDDTLVAKALRCLAATAGCEPRWRLHIQKRIPVAAGLGGGSSDAATALRLANETLTRPLPPDVLQELGRELGADVPFFLADGPQLGTGDGSELWPLDLPQDYWVVLVLPRGVHKGSTATVYEAFDARQGARGFEERRRDLQAALERVSRPRDFARLPLNDLATSPVAGQLLRLGAFRADVSGAGPVVYGLFARRADALRAERALGAAGTTWLTVPAWYF